MHENKIIFNFTTAYFDLQLTFWKQSALRLCYDGDSTSTPIFLTSFLEMKFVDLHFTDLKLSFHIHFTENIFIDNKCRDSF